MLPKIENSQITYDQNVKLNKLDNDYLSLVKDILKNGRKCMDRTGTGTVKVFGRQIRHNMKDGFPLLTTRKMFYNNGIHELIWFLKGDTNIKYLVDNNVNIWVGDCYKKYCNSHSEGEIYSRADFINKIKTDDDFAKKWGNLGTVYGKEWIDWDGINQIQEMIDMLKTNPDNRRMMVTAWNPTNVKKATLPPCHYAWQVFSWELTLEERLDFVKNNEQLNEEFNKAFPSSNINLEDDTIIIQLNNFLNTLNIPTRELSLMYQMRSTDLLLGQPTDNLVYGILLEMIAQVVNMVPGELIWNSGDTHIYLNQIDAIPEQLDRLPYQLPKLKLNKNIKNIFDFKFEDIEIVNYESHPKIIYLLSN